MLHSISNSRVETHNTCTMKEYYAYTLKLAPRDLNEPAYRGIVGHEALAQFYLTGERKKAFEVVEKEIGKAADEMDLGKLTLLNELIAVLTTYFEVKARYDNFEVLMVEETLRTPIDENIEFGMILDLLIKMPNNSLWVVDHKFVYNFKSDVDLQYDGQQAKYIKTCRENGYPVEGAIFNQIRYRSLKNPDPDSLFKRVPAKASNTRIEAIWDIQVESAKEIVYTPPKPRRVLAKAACKNCDFLRICSAELDGVDTKNIIELEYVKKKSPLEVQNDDL